MCQRCWGWLQRRVKLAQCWRDGLRDPDRPHAFSRPQLAHLSKWEKHASVCRETAGWTLGEKGRGDWLRRAGDKQGSGPSPLPYT